MPESTEKNALHHRPDMAADFTKIVDIYQRQLIAIAYRMLGNFEDARDSVQEVLVKFWRTNRRLDTGQDIFPMLMRMLVNFCIDHLRKRKGRQFFSFAESLIETLPARNPDPGQESSNNELNALLEASMTKLKPRQKAIFILRDVEGFSVRETANLVGCSENSVLTNLHLARKNLRTWLKPYLQE